MEEKKFVPYEERIDIIYATHVLSGVAFKLFFAIREKTIKEYHLHDDFDGWVEMSYSQLQEKTGVCYIARPVEELKLYDELITIDTTTKGMSNRYKINKDLIR